eukprot:SAG11_NODE_6009_length_1410_cov_2.707094_1_plen_92_part_00
MWYLISRLFQLLVDFPLYKVPNLETAWLSMTQSHAADIDLGVDPQFQTQSCTMGQIFGFSSGFLNFPVFLKKYGCMDIRMIRLLKKSMIDF